jgi:Tfp pilus assembly PilM family ATPase
LCIAGDDRPLYSRRVHNCEFGRVLNAIVGVLDVTLDEAQYLIECEGLIAAGVNRSGDLATAQAVTTAAADTLDELVRQINRTRQFTEMQRRHLEPSAVWLLGGGAAMRDVGPYLANELSLPVHIWSMAPESDEITCATGSRCSVFGGAAALSALAWRAA